jgi:hypothetical protein
MIILIKKTNNLSNRYLYHCTFPPQILVSNYINNNNINLNKNLDAISYFLMFFYHKNRQCIQLIVIKYCDVPIF